MMDPITAGTLMVVWVAHNIHNIPASAPGNPIKMIDGSNHDCLSVCSMSLTVVVRKRSNWLATMGLRESGSGGQADHPIGFTWHRAPPQALLAYRLMIDLSDLPGHSQRPHPTITTRQGAKPDESSLRACASS